MPLCSLYNAACKDRSFSLPASNSTVYLLRVLFILEVVWPSCSLGQLKNKRKAHEPDIVKSILAKWHEQHSTQLCIHVLNDILNVVNYSQSNVIMVDEKLASFHQYLRYSHKCGTTLFSVLSAIIWAYSHIASLVSVRFSSFEHVIYSWADVHCK